MSVVLQFQPKLCRTQHSGARSREELYGDKDVGGELILHRRKVGGVWIDLTSNL
jgi:hypothetical protein